MKKSSNIENTNLPEVDISLLRKILSPPVQPLNSTLTPLLNEPLNQNSAVKWIKQKKKEKKNNKKKKNEDKLNQLKKCHFVFVCAFCDKC